MKRTLYKNLRLKLITITLVVSIGPLITLGAAIYYQFGKLYRERIEDQVRHLAHSQGNAVDVFLRERTTILAMIVETQPFESLKEQENLSRLFQILNQRADGLGLVDLGVIDGIRRGFAVVRQRPIDVILMWLIMFIVDIGWMAVMIALGIVLIPVIIAAIIAAAALGSLPGLLAYGLASLFFEGVVPWIAAALIGVPFLVFSVTVAPIAAGMPMLFLGGLMEVFKSSVWTLSYRELLALEAGSVPTPVPDASSLKAAPAASGG